MTHHSAGIVLPVPRAPVLFRRALESIRNQSFTDWRLVVIVEPAQAGEIRRIAQAILGDDESRMQVLEVEPGTGHAAAINRGLDALETDLAVIHAESESWSPEFLQVMVQTHAAMLPVLPALGGIVASVAAVEETVTGLHVQIDAVTDWHAPGQRDPQGDRVLDIRHILQGNPFPAIAFLFDRRAALALGGYDPALPVLAEWEFHQRFCLHHDLWQHSERLAFHHLPDESDVGPDEAAFAAVLTNRWLRGDAAAGMGTLQILQALGQGDRPTANQRSRPKPGPTRSAVPALPEGGKASKGAFKQALSDFNRFRKRWI